MGRHITNISAVSLLVVSLACGTSVRDDGAASFGGITDAGTGPGAGTDAGSSPSSGVDGGDADGGVDGPEGGEGPLFDTPDGATAAGEGAEGSGCHKVDFLFVIDNSLSMGDEQSNLAASFPDFIATIQQQVATDWHVMVIDTDPQDKWDEKLAECHDGDCDGEDPNDACGIIEPQDQWTCGALPDPDPCDGALGAGIDHDDAVGRGTCGLADGRRWFDATQPDPEAAFACVANLYSGNSPELTMAGTLTAVSEPLVGAGGCNEGFLRDDAVLVVTFISDEEDAGDSPGDPMSWYADLLARKGGNQSAIVVLGLLGDTSLPGAVCPPDSVPGSNGGEYSPRLIDFVDAWGDRGLWGSVCAPDYGPFFEQAVGLIDTACDEFEPEG